MSKYLPPCLFVLGALILGYVFNTDGQQVVAAAIGGQLIGLSFVTGVYEYLLRRKP